MWPVDRVRAQHGSGTGGSVQRSCGRILRVGSLADDQATAYARDVVAGKIVAGPHVRAACRRHLDDLKKGHKRGLRWDVAASEKVIRYFRAVLTVELNNK